MDGIFISYRRDDSAGYAGRLYDRLAAHFGPERVFMDVEGIEPGLDFVEAIEAAVESCRVLIVIIGDEWTHGTDAAGRRRLDDPNDFIRLETGTALKRKIRVVPVLVGGAVMPLAGELPDELKALTRRQAIEINHKQWDASSAELIRTLEGILDRVAPQLEPAPMANAAALVAPEPAGASEESVSSAPGLPAAPEQAQEDPKTGQRWIVVGALGVAAAAGIVGLGWWSGQGVDPPQVVATPTATDRTQMQPTDAPVVVAEAAPRPRSDEVPKDTPAPAPTSEPAPKPAAAPAPAPVARPVVPPAPAPRPAPVIGEFKAEAVSGRARLCYRVTHADSLTLSPRPGELDKADQDCVTVPLDVPTVFTLTARSGSQTTRQRLAVVPPRAAKPTEAPQPAATPEPPAHATAPAPAPVVSSVPSPLPLKGERWTYRSSGKWRTSPKRRFEVVVQTVAGGVVTDALNVLEPTTGTELKRSRGGKPDFIAWDLIGQEFSPYFGAFVQLAQQGSLSGLPTPSLDSMWTGWSSQAKVLGQESVSVPAGSFQAHKVEVWSNRAQTGSAAMAYIEPVRVHYLIWYAPEVKRYVRMQRRVTTASNSESEKDLFELLAHRAP